MEDPFKEPAASDSPTFPEAAPGPAVPPGVVFTPPPQLYGGPGSGSPVVSTANPYEREGTVPGVDFVDTMPAKTAAAFYDGPSSQQPYVPPQPGVTGHAVGPPPPPNPTAAPATPAPPAEGTSRFWTIEFYKQFFNVNTRQVLLRMSNTLLPLNPPDFLMDRNWHYSGAAVETNPEELQEAGVVLSRDPDLYGPFWICTTLWMLLGIISNIMSRISYHRKPPKDGSAWSYDFTMASVACITVYVYCLGMACVVWGIMKWKALPVSLVDTLCLYGYSMFVFILTAILCMVPLSGLQWAVVMVGGAWSTAYLLLNFWHMWKSSLQRKWFIGIVAGVSLFHMLITLSFKFYFFNYPMTP